ncbi:hypothetical protein BJ878DRAFT_541797 [Calycina marina]|uniref:Uncharacterized protein n=1 Tax=Calycina marina TaxID=1763456 RepID=A0A9P7Z3I8_9HELO|nr:hypothetical protein BJ878DRAFT_541797 [Calycina marina]
MSNTAINDILQKLHIFFSSASHHNRIVHGLLTSYAIRAPLDAIEMHYKNNAAYQRQLPDPEAAILGDLKSTEVFKTSVKFDFYYMHSVNSSIDSVYRQVCALKVGAVDIAEQIMWDGKHDGKNWAVIKGDMREKINNMLIESVKDSGELAARLHDNKDSRRKHLRKNEHRYNASPIHTIHTTLLCTFTPPISNYDPSLRLRSQQPAPPQTPKKSSAESTALLWLALLWLALIVFLLGLVFIIAGTVWDYAKDRRKSKRKRRDEQARSPWGCLRCSSPSPSEPKSTFRLQELFGGKPVIRHPYLKLQATTAGEAAGKGQEGGSLFSGLSGRK